MFFGIAGIVFVAFITTAATDEVWTGLTATWASDNTSNFFTLPTTLEVAQNEGWTTIEGVNPPAGITPLALAGDPTLTLLFNSEKVVGFQVAFRVEDIDVNQPLKWDELDVIIPKTLNNVSFYTSTAYFSYDESTDTRTVLIQEKNGFFEVPTNTSRLPSETEYLLKNCVPTMGDHYYTWHPKSDCSNVFPWLVLGHKDDVIGLGYQAFGTVTAMGKRVWSETIPAFGLYTVMSDPPQCAYDAIAEYGIISIHVWFVAEPRKVSCN